MELFTKAQGKLGTGFPRTRRNGAPRCVGDARKIKSLAARPVSVNLSLIRVEPNFQ
jgi:hypothetical protein